MNRYKLADAIGNAVLIFVGLGFSVFVGGLYAGYWH